MIIDFEKAEELIKDHLHGGEEYVSLKSCRENGLKTDLMRIPAGGSIGSHYHADSKELDYIISGEGTVIIDELTEFLYPGVLHICSKGSMHSILNTGDEDLLFLSIIIE